MSLRGSRDTTTTNGPRVTVIEPYARIHGAEAAVHVIWHSRTAGSREADS